MNHSHIPRWPDDPGTHVAFPDRAPRLFPDRGSRLRNTVDRLLCAVAVAGIGGACWGFWLEYDENRDWAASEKAIAEACGDVVDPAAGLPALSPSATARAARESGEEADDGLHGPDPWWAALDSWFGDEAKIVYAEAGYKSQRHLAPGTAGGYPRANAWWASAVCRGVPAVHTLTVADHYEKAVRKQLGALLRAYVDDVTERRGCTDVKFPKPADLATK